jgi:anti-anti-sigma regulatory factor
MAEFQVAQRADDFVVIRLQGALFDKAFVALVHRELEDHYVDDGVRVIRTDVSAVPQISLEGVGALLDLWREARRRGKSFEVEGATGQVRDKLATTGVLTLLTGGEERT